MRKPAVKKTARRPKSENYVHKEKLEKVTFRVEAEIKRIWKVAADLDGLSLSDWLRGVINYQDFCSVQTLKTPPQVKPLREYNRADPKLICEIARIGGNLNQMSRQINRANIVGQPLDVLTFISGLAEMQGELREALQMLHQQGAVKIAD